MTRIGRLLLSSLAIAAFPLAAQLHPNNARGFDPEKVYQTGDIDNINVFNGNLVVTLPVGPKFPVSETLSYGLTLVDNGNPWDYHNGGTGASAVPSRFANAGVGWQLTLGDLIGPTAPSAVQLNRQGHWVYAGPDGSERVFHRVLHAEEEGTTYSGVTQPDAAPGEVIAFTTDSSYLRLKRLQPIQKFHGIPDPDNPQYYFVPQYELEFPDGTRQTFTGEEYVTDTLDDALNRLYEPDLVYKVTKIEDRSGNWVNIAYTPTKWTITDSRLRTQTVELLEQEFYALGGPIKRHLVSSVRLTAPHGKTLEYAFSYTPYHEVPRPCVDSDVRAGLSVTTYVRYLSSVTARDLAATATPLMTWSFEHEELAATPDCSNSAGHLKKMTLPTGGTVEYTAGFRIFPTPKEGMPRDKDGPDIFELSTAVRTRTVKDIDGTTATWTYLHHLQNAGTYWVETEDGSVPRNGNRELVVLVNDPLDRTTAHYFNANSMFIGGDSCFVADEESDYGLPFTRQVGTDAGNGLFLSQVVYPQRCNTWDNSNICPVASPCLDANKAAVGPIRRTYVAYEHDTVRTNGGGRNSRLRATRTAFVDDAGCGGVTCYTQTSLTDFDGLGHYRAETRSSNFGSTATRTVTTAYNANPAAGTYTPAGNSSPATYMIATADPWILNVYSSVIATDATGTAVSAFCFSSDGLLARKRTQVSASGTRQDLLASFTYSGGNLTAEDYAGGDVTPLPDGFSTCMTTAPTPEYEITHTYSNGVRSRSEYDGMTFKTLDLDVDASGRPTASRDTGAVETKYTYDVLGRLTEVRPSGDAWTEYVYKTHSSASAPASVTVRQWPNGAKASGTPLTERAIYVDGSGRPIQIKTSMPAGWSTVESRYDALGRKIGASMPEYRSTADYEAAFTPLYETAFTYDTFGRPTVIKTADGKSATTAYTGTRTVERTVSVGGTASWNATASRPVVAERSVTTTETYDGHGRLVTVEEDAGTVKKTTYSYDYADRLIGVAQGAQRRVFSYDARGFLLAEQHPEKGASGRGWVDYRSYDARGHAKSRLEGTIALTFAYDAAERLLSVSDTDGGANRLLKEFAFGTSGSSNGKLTASHRYNHTDLGKITVTENYTYGGRGGRVDARETVVGSTSLFNGATFQLGQTWDELGNLATLTYPTTTLATRGLTVKNGYSNALLTSVGNYATITYQATGLVNTVTHGSGSTAVTEKWLPDPSGMARPSAVEVTDAAQGVWKYGDYRYDGAGNIAVIGNTSYTYDDVQRLQSHTKWTSATTYANSRYHYDSYGNILGTSYDGCAGMSCHKTVMADLKINSYTNREAEKEKRYDDAGSVVADSFHNYTYDATAMMTALSGSNRTERYLYTAGDERIAIVRNASGGHRTTWTVRGLDNRLLRTWTDDNSSGTRQFTWTEDEIWRAASLLGSDSPTGLKRYHLDHLGSPRLVTNASGLQIGEQDFEPFGTGGTLDGGRLQFTAHERDVPESGTGLALDYMHARFYNGAVGRFLSVDPINSANPARPQSWNRYAYALNNPLTLVDPDGRCAVPAGLREGLVGVCIQSFIGAKRIGGIGFGDNRTFARNDPDATFRTSYSMVMNPRNGNVVQRVR